MTHMKNYDTGKRKQNLSLWQSEWKLFRDILLFLGGLAGVGFEALAKSSPDPSLLVLFGAMLGLPAFFQRDESLRRDKDEKEDNDPNQE